AAARAHLVLSHRSGDEYRGVQGGRFEFHNENSAASISRLHWRRTRGRRIAQFGCSRGFWRKYGRARGERWKHALLARERGGRAALFRRWARRDGRRRSGGYGD